jgi:hypothetical protein
MTSGEARKFREAEDLIDAMRADVHESTRLARKLINDRIPRLIRIALMDADVEARAAALEAMLGDGGGRPNDQDRPNRPCPDGRRPGPRPGATQPCVQGWRTAARCS